MAQTDVTDTYLKNAGFESSPIFDGSNLGTDKNANATICNFAHGFEL